MTHPIDGCRQWTLACGPERVVETVLAPERFALRLPDSFAAFELRDLRADGWQALGRDGAGAVAITVALDRPQQCASLQVLEQSSSASASRSAIGPGGNAKLLWCRVPEGTRVQFEGSEAWGLASVVGSLLSIAEAREALLHTRIEQLKQHRCTVCLGPLADAGCLWADHGIMNRFVLGTASTGKRVEECPREGRGGEFGHSSGKRLGAGGASSSASKRMLP